MNLSRKDLVTRNMLLICQSLFFVKITFPLIFNELLLLRLKKILLKSQKNDGNLQKGSFPVVIVVVISKFTIIGEVYNKSL